MKTQALLPKNSRFFGMIVLLTMFIVGCDSFYKPAKRLIGEAYIKRCNDGMIAVKSRHLINRKWGFISETGKEIVPCIYSEVQCFSEGLAAVKKNGKWGFIDKDGYEIIPFKIVPFKYDAVVSFEDGLARVRIGNEENGKWRFINKNGIEVVPCKYSQIREYSDGLAMVSSNDKWGFIGKNGLEVIPCKYEAALGFFDGMAAVKSNKKWGFINKSGNVIIPFQYDYAESFRSDGYAQVGERRDTGVRNWNFRMGLIDKHGNLIVPYKYRNIGVFKGDLAIVNIGKNQTYTTPGGTKRSQVVTHRGVVNKNGQEVLSLADYFTLSISNDIIEVKASRNASNQFYDKSGKSVRR